MSWVTEPLSYGFFARAVLVAVLSGGVCAAVGAFVVVRRMSYIAHGLSHAVIGGAAVAGALEVSAAAGAGVWALVSAILVERVARRRGIHADTAIGIVTTASFAVGVAVITAGGRWEASLEGLLFGSVLGADRGDVVLAAAVTAVVAGVLVARYRPLLFVVFDREVAEVHGVPVARLEVLLAVVLAAAVVASMRVLGVLLVAAAVVVPPATARVLTDRFEALLPLAAGLGAASALPGLYLSWYADVAPGAAVVLVQTALYAAAAASVRLRRRSRRADAETSPQPGLAGP